MSFLFDLLPATVTADEVMSGGVVVVIAGAVIIKILKRKTKNTSVDTIVASLGKAKDDLHAHAGAQASVADDHARTIEVLSAEETAARLESDRALTIAGKIGTLIGNAEAVVIKDVEAIGTAVTGDRSKLAAAVTAEIDGIKTAPFPAIAIPIQGIATPSIMATPLIAPSVIATQSSITAVGNGVSAEGTAAVPGTGVKA